MKTAAINTIKNHIDNIDLMIEAHNWGKPIEECLAEIGKSTAVIRRQIDYIKKEAGGKKTVKRKKTLPICPSTKAHGP